MFASPLRVRRSNCNLGFAARRVVRRPPTSLMTIFGLKRRGAQLTVWKKEEKSVIEP